MSNEPKFTIQLTPPTAARRCIRCAQLITFNWQEIPVVQDRRTMRVVATFYVHPTVEACREDIERASILVAGEPIPAHDIGLQRAQMLRDLVREAQDNLLASLDPGPEPDPDIVGAIHEAPAPTNYAKRTRGSRERRPQPHGGLL